MIRCFGHILMTLIYRSSDNWTFLQSYDDFDEMLTIIDSLCITTLNVRDTLNLEI